MVFCTGRTLSATAFLHGRRLSFFCVLLHRYPLWPSACPLPQSFWPVALFSSHSLCKPSAAPPFCPPSFSLFAHSLGACFLTINCFRLIAGETGQATALTWRRHFGMFSFALCAGLHFLLQRWHALASRLPSDLPAPVHLGWQPWHFAFTSHLYLLTLYTPRPDLLRPASGRRCPGRFCFAIAEVKSPSPWFLRDARSTKFGLNTCRQPYSFRRFANDLASCLSVPLSP